MRLAIANLVLVIGCIASSYGQGQVGYGYLPPDPALVPGGSGTPSSVITPSTPRRTTPPPRNPPTPGPPGTPPRPPPPPPPSRPPPPPPSRPPPPPPSRPPPPPPSRPPPPPPSTRPPRPPPSRPPPSRPPPSRPPPDDHDHHHHHHSDDPLQWLRDSVPGEPGVDYPILAVVPQTAFTCASRVSGYYADIETRCQAFHVCSGPSQISFLCPNGTIFNQEHFTCEWWPTVKCETTEAFYELNNQIGVVPDKQ